MECGVWSAAPGTQNDDRDLPNVAPATKTATQGEHFVRDRARSCETSFNSILTLCSFKIDVFLRVFLGT